MIVTYERFGPIVLPVGRVDSAELQHVIVAIKRSYPNKELDMVDPKPRPEIEIENDGATGGVPPEVAEELDEEEKEFRALRRDLDGVKGAGATGFVTISVGKTPEKNEFFRTHPEFRPIVPIVNVEIGMDKHYFAVAPDMVTALSGIGITVSDHALYLTITARGAIRVVPVRQASGDNEQNEYDRTKEIGLVQAMDGWVRLYADLENRAYQVFPAPAERFTTPQWPELKPAKIFKLAFRDKGRLVDSTEHPLFKKWAARDAD